MEDKQPIVLPDKYLLIRQHPPQMKQLDRTFILRCRDALRVTEADVRNIFYGSGFVVRDRDASYARELETVLIDYGYPYVKTRAKAVPPSFVRRADLRLRDNRLRIERKRDPFAIDLSTTPCTIAADNGHCFLTGSAASMVEIRRIFVATEERAVIIDMVHTDFVDVIDGPSHDQIIQFFQNILQTVDSTKQTKAYPGLNCTAAARVDFATMLRIAHLHSFSTARVPTNLLEPDDRMTPGSPVSGSDTSHQWNHWGRDTITRLLDPFNEVSTGSLTTVGSFVFSLLASLFLSYQTRSAIPWICMLIASLLIFSVRLFRLKKTYNVFSSLKTGLIRSTAVGPVRLYGKAVADDPLIAPYAGKPCLAYRTTVMEYRESEGYGTWTNAAIRQDVVDRVWLDDSTGIILVNARNATIQFPEGETYGAYGSTPGPLEISWNALKELREMKRGDTRVYEQHIPDGSNMFVLGFAQPSDEVRDHETWIEKMMHDRSNVPLFDTNGDGKVDDLESGIARNRLYAKRLESGHLKGQASLLEVSTHSSFPHLTVSTENETQMDRTLSSRIEVHWILIGVLATSLILTGMYLLGV